MSSYWENRLAKAQEAVTKKTEKQIDKQMRKYYRAAAERIIEDFERVYEKVLLQQAAGKAVTPALLYRLDAYWKMEGQLRNVLERFGDKQISLLSKYFKSHYFGVYNSLNIDGLVSFSTIDEAAVKQIINSIWVADGKTFSQRVWNNTERLLETLNEELVNCVLTGAKTSTLKQKLQERFDISYHRANTLARTELAHLQTRAAEERYKSYGIKYVEVLVDVDDRTCDRCKALVGKKFPINEAPTLPLHPNERCCLIPVIK